MAQNRYILQIVSSICCLLIVGSLGSFGQKLKQGTVTTQRNVPSASGIRTGA